MANFLFIVIRMASVPAILLSVLFFVLILIDVTGNMLVCLIVYRRKQMRRPMNYLLVNLAVADILIGVFMLPRHVFHHTFEHPTGKLRIGVSPTPPLTQHFAPSETQMLKLSKGWGGWEVSQKPKLIRKGHHWRVFSSLVVWGSFIFVSQLTIKHVEAGEREDRKRVENGEKARSARER